MSLTVENAYRWILKNLNSNEVKTEAKIILEEILNFSITDILLKPESLISSKDFLRIKDIVSKRNIENIPLAYILENTYFMGYEFFINKDVLIPRPETELLVETVIKEVKERKMRQLKILDLCTGSGCIAISLKKALPSAKVYASDISDKALNVASINAHKHNVQINLVLGDFLDPFLPRPTVLTKYSLPIIHGDPPYFNIIVSNPPYVSEEEYSNLEPELYHEPKHALVGFPYQHIYNQAQSLIYPEGFMAFEFGITQLPKLQQIFDTKISKYIKDYAGIERHIIVEK